MNPVSYRCAGRAARPSGCGRESQARAVIGGDPDQITTAAAVHAGKWELPLSGAGKWQRDEGGARRRLVNSDSRPRYLQQLPRTWLG